MPTLSSKTQFRLGTGLILFIFCLAVSLAVYRIGKEGAEQRVFKETEIYIAAVDATRTYVKDVLRPRMYDILPEDHFVVEAMSTSFVGREVMYRVHDRFNDFSYKRAALVPIKPARTVDALEADFIQRFNKDPNLREWSGKRGDPRADIYTLGILLYRMAAGRLPFEDSAKAYKAHAHRSERIVPPSYWHSHLPKAIETVILRATAVAPRNRYPWVEDFGEALDKAIPKD